MKTLYLLRHAKAEPASGPRSDADRPLAPRGRIASSSIGEYIKKEHYAPDVALVSPAARTIETYERVMSAAGFSPEWQRVKKLYLATAGDMLDQVHHLDDRYGSVLIVAHNPGLHHLSLALSDPAPTERRRTLEIKYPTGALTVLRFDAAHWTDIAPGHGKFVDFVTPEEFEG